MMEIDCAKCGKQYLVDTSGIKGKKAKITCDTCHHVIRFDVSAASSQAVGSVAETSRHGRDTAPRTKGMKKIGWMNSLKIQINTLIVCIVAIVMGCYAGFYYYSAKTARDKKLQYSADITAKRLSQHLIEPFWALDDEILKEALASEMLDRQIFAINLFDRNGKDIYMGYKRDGNWQVIDSQASLSGGFTTRRMDIVRGDDTIGGVEIYLTDKFLKADFKRSMITIAITAVILVSAIVLIMSFIFQKMIIHPITNLAGVADRISLGDMKIEIPIDSNNEIGLLAQAFNRLKTSVQVSMQALGTNR